MQRILLFALCCLNTISLTAQIKLNVEGNARITGRLEIGSGIPQQNTFLGVDNGSLITSGTQNTFLGYGAGFFTNTGSFNTFIGPNAGRLNQSGRRNVYIGKSAGQQGSSGEQNTMIGTESGTNTTVSDNTFIGYRSGYLNMGGQFNTFIGNQAGEKNTNGEKNTFLGFFAGNNTTGSNNTFLGFQAGLQNTQGNDNTFVGYDAGTSTNTGYRNTLLGMNAGFSNLTGFDNTYVGHSAGRSNTSGNRNTFIGANAGYFSNGDTCNTFIGHFAGFSNSSGVNNAFTGYQSGVSNTTGTNNTFYGFESGYSNSSGENNTFVGRSAGSGNQTGTNNVFVGHVSGRDNGSGQGNTYVGTFAAFSVVNGQFLTAFGYNAGTNQPRTSSLENAFAFGSNAVMTRSNTGVLGNVSTQQIGGYVNWGTVSDDRMKADVREDVKGLDFILQLHPVSYQLDAVRLQHFLQGGEAEQEQLRSNYNNPADKEAHAVAAAAFQRALVAKSRERYTGFIAQEVEQAATETGFAFSGVVKPANEKDHYRLRYAEFVVPLVKAVQEQQEQIGRQQEEQDLLREQVQGLQQELKRTKEKHDQQISELRSLVEQLLDHESIGNEEGSTTLEMGETGWLTQNHPNPFLQSTVLEYYVPDHVRQAQIQITSVDGKILKVLPIEKTGAGQVRLGAEFYTAGTYFYSLVQDGQIIETKRMLLVK